MDTIKRKLRMGMVGGGRGAFIGSVHRMAAELDGQIELVCGAFSSKPQKSRLSGADYYLPAHRCYGTYQEMFLREREWPEGERMDFVAIVTPNYMHFPVAQNALECGFHVMCDKPVTFDLREARLLGKLVKRSGLLFGLTHNYTGYPMVKEAREMVRAGRIGQIRKIVVEYPQGWLASALEKSGQKQADWRTDPKRAGASCCMGDIGTHADNLASYITGLKMESVCADLTTFVKGRRLEDDGNVLVRYKGGARGVLYASQISIDEENALRIRIYGDQGGLEWSQEEPNTLILKWPDRPRQIVRAGGNYAGRLSSAASANCRLPAGHPEGFLEAFANLYRNFGNALRARLENRQPAVQDMDFPGIEEGIQGMAFIEAVVASSKNNSKWVNIKNP